MTQYVAIFQAEHLSKLEEMFPGICLLEIQGMGLGNKPTHQVLVTPLKPMLDPVPEDASLQKEGCCG